MLFFALHYSDNVLMSTDRYSDLLAVTISVGLAPIVHQVSCGITSQCTGACQDFKKGVSTKIARLHVAKMFKATPINWPNRALYACVYFAVPKLICIIVIILL